MATVLVVDDLAANRRLVTTLLGYRGHDVLEAGDGMEALTIARAEHPDIVVSDVLMPGIDGLELAFRLRCDADPVTAQAPVIFYTGNYLEQETRPVAEACGVSRVVRRDADPRELLDAVDEVLEAGPMDAPMTTSDDFADAHCRAVNAKLMEKVRALQASEGRFAVMASASPVGMAMLDIDGHAVYGNPRLCQITGRTPADLAGRGWLVCVEPRFRDEVLEVVRGPAGAVEHRYRTHLTRPDKADRWLRVHVRPFRDDECDHAGAVVMVDDVTDVLAAHERALDETRRRLSERRLREIAQMDTLRRMADDIAHDFTSLLDVMTGLLQLVGESITAEAAAGRLESATATALLNDLALITSGGEQATKLTERLFAFGHHTINEPAIVDVNAYIAAFVRGVDECRIDVALRLSDDRPVVCIDRRGFDRLLNILFRNACEAMPGGGVVTISTSTYSDGASITVADAGTGMAPEVRRRAFEPFFSTKRGCRTAGLGLAVAHDIVSQAHGEILLSAGTDGGTVVDVRLPRTADGRMEPKTGNLAVAGRPACDDRCP